MRITSPAFQANQPSLYRTPAKAPNINPPLEFRDIPADTQSMALMFEDVDAPAKPWVHWLVFNIPPTTTRRNEHALPEGSTEGIANGGTPGYEGACPKYFAGTHHYYYKLYALDTVLNIPNTSDRKAVLAEAQLVGTAHGEMVEAQ